ncbi:GGDEF domain-containing protein [Paraglaciecola sp. L3A3]|uniref:GGDEF domain-containing protein n=1 Tax=Paraglaciecola sp. L3A3 TaxID=2686358 RepID=UPI001E2F94E3|nr:GGDEF domain-containing protein [Paraglaciecola sp. L3A3]
MAMHNNEFSLRGIMLNQLKEKYQLSILSILGIVSVLGVSPFAVIRYLEGNNTAAFINMLIVLGITIIVIYALYTKKVQTANGVAAVFINVGVVLITITNGIDSLLWVYPVFASTFFLVKPNAALKINAIAGLALVTLFDVFTLVSMTSFIVTILMLSLSGFIHASHSAKQFSLLETLNTIDALTGALNRRALTTDLEAAVSLSERNNVQQLLVIMDIDYFKMVNDKYGHDGGDQVLKNMVTIINGHIRKHDRLYRYGGEEFVLLISELDHLQQHSFIDNLRAHIKKDLKTPDGEVVTVSFGVAAWQPGTSILAWLKSADKALYQAKAQGRDCVVFSDK